LLDHHNLRSQESGFFILEQRRFPASCCTAPKTAMQQSLKWAFS
jgi:hypothetical protein